MKKSLKDLKLNKEVISNLSLDTLEGGGTCYCGNGTLTLGEMATCEGGEIQCF
jgi:hypothetical protein